MMNTNSFRRALLLLIACFYISLSYGQVKNPAIETYFNGVLKYKQLNGNILLADHNNIVYERSFGHADYASRITNTPGSRYNTASISKIFTATAILQLKEKRLLSLDDPLTTYLPDFPYKDVRIKHLLTHTSGMADLELYEDLIRKYPDTVITNKNIIPELKKWQRGLQFKPGDKYQYCNTGYSLLAILIEKITGIPFQDYLKRNIFQPAGMHESYVQLYSGQTGWNDRRCVRMHLKQHPYYDTIYVPVDSIRQYKYTNYNCSGMIGQGNIITTTKDLLRFDKAYFTGKLISPATMEEAFTPVKLNNGSTFYTDHMDTMHGEGKMSYGLGWEIFEQPAYGKSVGHGGFNFGLATFYFRNLQRKQTILAFDNAPGSEFGRIIASSLSLLNGQSPLELRTKKSLINLYGTALVKYGIDNAISRFNACKADTAHFYLSEWEMNELGYDLFYKSSVKDHKILALEVFKIATLLFPDSFNPYDSYGQLLMEMSKKEEAILMYQKSISLNPENEDGKRILKKLSEDQ